MLILKVLALAFFCLCDAIVFDEKVPKNILQQLTICEDEIRELHKEKKKIIYVFDQDFNIHEVEFELEGDNFQYKGDEVYYFYKKTVKVNMGNIGFATFKINVDQEISELNNPYDRNMYATRDNLFYIDNYSRYGRAINIFKSKNQSKSLLFLDNRKTLSDPKDHKSALFVLKTDKDSLIKTLPIEHFLTEYGLTGLYFILTKVSVIADAASSILYTKQLQNLLKNYIDHLKDNLQKIPLRSLSGYMDENQKLTLAIRSKLSENLSKNIKDKSDLSFDDIVRYVPLIPFNLFYFVDQQNMSSVLILPTKENEQFFYQVIKREAEPYKLVDDPYSRDIPRGLRPSRNGEQGDYVKIDNKIYQKLPISNLKLSKSSIYLLHRNAEGSPSFIKVIADQSDIIIYD